MKSSLVDKSCVVIDGNGVCPWLKRQTMYADNGPFCNRNTNRNPNNNRIRNRTGIALVIAFALVFGLVRVRVVVFVFELAIPNVVVIERVIEAVVRTTALVVAEEDEVVE